MPTLPIGRQPCSTSMAGYAQGMVTMRSEAFHSWPDGYQTLQLLSERVRDSGLEPGLVELVKMRASQINGCSYCIDMHSKDARTQGESEQRLYTLSAWREAPFFTGRERAALALTEAVTLIAEDHISQTIVDDAAALYAPRRTDETPLSHHRDQRMEQAGNHNRRS